MTQRGGKRPGSGRKPNPAKALATDQKTAERILKQLGYEAEIVNLFQTCGDARLKFQIITGLENRAFGRPVQNIKYMHDENNPIEVRVTLAGVIREIRERKREYERNRE